MAEVIEVDQNDADLEFVREKRKEILGLLLKDHKLPEDTKELAIAAGILADMDRAAIGRKRIKTDDKANSNAAAAVELIANLFKQTNVKVLGNTGLTPRLESPVLDDNIIDVEIVPGELEISAKPEDYNSFMASTSDRG